MGTATYTFPDGRTAEIQYQNESQLNEAIQQLESMSGVRQFPTQEFPGVTAETSTGKPRGVAYEPTVRNGGAGFMANLMGNVPTDPATRVEQFAQRLFPNDPEARKNRVGIRGGEVVFVNDEGQIESAESGFSSGAGAFTSGLPELAGAGVGAALGTLVGNPMAGSVLGATGARGFKRAASNLFLDEPQTVTGNLQDLGTEGALTLAGEGIGRFAVGAFNRGAVNTADRFNRGAIADKIGRIERSTGIKLDTAQAGDIPELRYLKQYASENPGQASELVEALDQAQVGQVGNAIDRVLGVLSKSGDKAALTGSTVNGAKAAIEAAKLQRREATQPLYEEAFKAGETVDVRPMLDSIDKQLGTARGKIRSALMGARKLIAGPRKETGEMFTVQKGATPRTNAQSVQELHQAKVALDAMLEGDAKSSLDSISKGRVREIRDGLIERLEAASPRYAAAQKAYSELSTELVDPLSKGYVGLLAKLDGPKQVKTAAGLARDIFADPGTVSIVKSQLSRKDPQAWRDFVRLGLEDALDKAFKETRRGLQAGGVANTFRKEVVGTPRREAAMRRALPDDVQPVFNDVMEALDLIRRDLPDGSPTSRKTAVREQQKSNVGSVVRFALSPRTQIIDRIEQNATDKNARAIAEALSDPQKLARLKELRKLSRGEERSVNMLSAIFGAEAGAEAADFRPSNGGFESSAQLRE